MSSTAIRNFSKVLIIGAGRTPSSIAVCIAASGSKVTLVSSDPVDDQARTDIHLGDLVRYSDREIGGDVKVESDWQPKDEYDLVLIAGYSDEILIRHILSQLESTGRDDQIISVATDHLELRTLQQGRAYPDRIVVLNWTEPAHTTFFLEIVHNDQTALDIVNRIQNVAIQHWGKDPYTVPAELGVRGRMSAAMAREAMYLVDEGYANIEDVDRVCRNDAGTYLPFAGNFQYMDLMGTYAYGVVMQKLNQELTNTVIPPPAFKRFAEPNEPDNSGGLYNYSKENQNKWESRMRSFSFEIRELMEKYPFGAEEEETAENKIRSGNYKNLK